MPRPRHSALFWAAHIGAVSAGLTMGVGLLLALTATDARVGRLVAACGVACLTIAGGLAVAGARRHRR